MTQLAVDTDIPKLGNAAHQPGNLSLPVAAGQKFFRGSLVLKNSSGYGTRTVALTSPAVGACTRDVDNTDGDAGDKDVEAVRGVFRYSNSEGGDEITIADRFKECYVVDDNTVSKTNGTNTRGRAGIVWDVDSAGVWVLVGPEAILALDGVEASVAELAAHLTNPTKRIPVPLGTFRIYSTGGALIPFNDGVADGIDPTAESLGFKFNVASTAKIAASVLMPADLDDTHDMQLYVKGFRVGALDTTAALTAGIFFRVDGAAFNADADAGGATTAFDGATTVVTTVSLTILAADVPAGASSLLVTLEPTAALDADDLEALEVWFEYTPKILT